MDFLKTLASTILISIPTFGIRVDPPTITIVGNQVFVSNVSEFALQLMQFPTNNPSFNNPPILLKEIQVFLNHDLVPTPIFGLHEFLNETYTLSDTAAYTAGEAIHNPFHYGCFKQNTSVGDLCDTLSSLSKTTPSTSFTPKTYTLIFMLGKEVVEPVVEPANDSWDPFKDNPPHEIF